MRNAIPLYFIVLFALLVSEGVSLETAPRIGKLAPPFELSDMNGKKVAFADHKEKVILINFWASFCGPCKKEMPSLNTLFLELQKEGFVILAVSIDSKKKPVHKFLKKKKVDFPVLLDPEQEVYFDEYGVLGLPTSFLIDREGIVREIIRGEREWNSTDMKEKIRKLLTKNKTEKNKEGK
jgi:cytochrome c biogenesis protein CcmG/thiol:disulfide interchange protein DsbE